MAKARLIQLFSGLPFADTFPGIFMGNGDMFFKTHENVIDTQREGVAVKIRWSDLFGSYDRDGGSYYRLPQRVHKIIKEIDAIVMFLMDTHYTEIFNIDKEELCAHLKKRSKHSKSRSRSGDTGKPTRSLPMSTLRTALR